VGCPPRCTRAQRDRGWGRRPRRYRGNRRAAAAADTGASLGYAGGVDLRAGYLGGDAEGHLPGVAARSGATTVSLTAGGGIGGVHCNTATHLPVELALEAPSGRRT